MSSSGGMGANMQPKGLCSLVRSCSTLGGESSHKPPAMRPLAIQARPVDKSRASMTDATTSELRRDAAIKPVTV